MANKIVTTPRKFLPMLLKMNKAMEGAAKAALRDAAAYGTKAVQREIGRSRPKPVATGDYRRSWTWEPTKRGAILGSLARQSYWVEAGRKAGKRPPMEAILRWVRAKKIHATKRGDLKAALRRPGESGRKSKAKRLARLARLDVGLAYAIARKIGKEGTPPRWVLRRALPSIGQKAKKWTREGVRRELGRLKG